MRELIRRTIFATDNESSRYALGGVLLEMAADKITGVGTDGRRLAKMEVPAQGVGGHQTGDSMTIVPTKAMQLIERALTDGDAEIQIAARANEVLVRSPRATIYSRLVEGRFPKWRDVFPQRTGAMKVELTVGPLLFGGSPGGDRHQRGEPRRRFQLSTTASWCSAAERPKRASRASSCRSPTTARRFRSRSTRAT